MITWISDSRLKVTIAFDQTTPLFLQYYNGLSILNGNIIKARIYHIFVICSVLSSTFVSYMVYDYLIHKHIMENFKSLSLFYIGLSDFTIG